jgi:hypothetical protein
MKRIGRRILAAVMVLSVLVSTALLALCVRWLLGLDDQAYLHLSRTTVRFEVESDKRRVVIARFLPGPRDRAKPMLTIYPFQTCRANPQEESGAYGDLFGWSSRQSQFLGIGYGHGANGAGAYSVVVLPIWLLIATAIASLGLIYRANRLRTMLRHQQSGRCARCGYDMRATPNRCPECDTIPPKAKA